MADLKSLHESINNFDPDEDANDVFGRSVAMQLKKLSEEKDVLAQCEIQNILTQMGTEEIIMRNCSTSTPAYSNPASVTSLSLGESTSNFSFVNYDTSNNNDLVRTAIINSFSSPTDEI